MQEVDPSESTQSTSASGRSTSGLGGLSSLSTLTGLLDTASTFKPKQQDQPQGQRINRGEGFGTGKPRQGQFEGGRFDDFFRPNGGGNRQGACRGGWKGDRTADFGRTRGDGLQKSFQPRAFGAGADTSSVSRIGTTQNDPSRNRSCMSAPSTSVAPQSDYSVPTTPAKTDVIESTCGVSDIGIGGSPASSSPVAPLVRQETLGKQVDIADRSHPASAPWRPRRTLDPKEQLRRDTNGLLNKLTIENFPTVAERLAKLIEELTTKEDLETVVEQILDKAFSEPDFSELYADLCLVLRYRYFPVLNSPTPQRPIFSSVNLSLFSSLLVYKWREAFDKLPLTVELTEDQKSELSQEDQEILIVKMKTRVRGVCILIAEFLVRRVVSMKGFYLAASVLLTREAPEEHFIEGACQMLSTAGAFLDSDPAGKSLVETCFGRLQEIQSKDIYSKRITCLIQDLVDARKVGWHKKIHKEKAKGLSTLKEEVENADLVGGSVVTAQYGTVVKLGHRSNLGNANYAKYLKEQEELFKTRTLL